MADLRAHRLLLCWDSLPPILPQWTYFLGAMKQFGALCWRRLELNLYFSPLLCNGAPQTQLFVVIVTGVHIVWLGFSPGVLGVRSMLHSFSPLLCFVKLCLEHMLLCLCPFILPPPLVRPRVPQRGFLLLAYTQTGWYIATQNPETKNERKHDICLPKTGRLLLIYLQLHQFIFCKWHNLILPNV